MNMISRLTQPTPAAEAAPAEPDPVAGLRARRRELTDHIKALETAAVLISPRGGFKIKDMSPNLRKAAEPYMGLSVRELTAERDKAEHELAGAVDDLADAMEDARRAAVQAAKIKARALEPEHRAAVAQIADALQSLADALADEKRLRGRVSLGAIDYLPNLGLPVLGVPRDPNSHVSRWATAARKAGYLE